MMATSSLVTAIDVYKRQVEDYLEAILVLKLEKGYCRSVDICLLYTSPPAPQMAPETAPVRTTVLPGPKRPSPH